MLSLNGCGYKSAPFYSQEIILEDENIKIIKKEQSKEID